MDQQLPSAIEVTDEDGVVHWTSPYSELAKRLKTAESEVVPDAPEDDAPADNDDARTINDQPSVRERGPRTSGR